MSEKVQLIAIHQQRVQSDLNDKKRSAMEHYMDVNINQIYFVCIKLHLVINTCSCSVKMPSLYYVVHLREISQYTIIKTRDIM